MTSLAPSRPDLERCSNCGRHGWHKTHRCPEIPHGVTSAVNPSCTWWCTAREDPEHCHDAACWGIDHYVALSTEHGYPRDVQPGSEAVFRFDPPRVGANAYRREPGRREVVYLHAYRPHDNPHLDVDVNLKLTVAEARELATELLAVAEEIAIGEAVTACTLCDAQGLIHDGFSDPLRCDHGEFSEPDPAPVIEVLNSYGAFSIWRDVITKLPEFDPDATAELPPLDGVSGNRFIAGRVEYRYLTDNDQWVAWGRIDLPEPFGALR